MIEVRDKFDRLLGKDGDSGRYGQRLTDVVERWRNPYSHGGFEKDHGATIYLHTPGWERRCRSA